MLGPNRRPIFPPLLLLLLLAVLFGASLVSSIRRVAVEWEGLDDSGGGNGLPYEDALADVSLSELDNSAGSDAPIWDFGDLSKLARGKAKSIMGDLGQVSSRTAKGLQAMIDKKVADFSAELMKTQEQCLQAVSKFQEQLAEGPAKIAAMAVGALPKFWAEQEGLRQKMEEAQQALVTQLMTGSLAGAAQVMNEHLAILAAEAKEATGDLKQQLQDSIEALKDEAAAIVESASEDAKNSFGEVFGEAMQRSTALINQLLGEVEAVAEESGIEVPADEDDEEEEEEEEEESNTKKLSSTPASGKDKADNADHSKDKPSPTSSGSGEDKLKKPDVSSTSTDVGSKTNLVKGESKDAKQTPTSTGATTGVKNNPFVEKDKASKADAGGSPKPRGKLGPVTTATGKKTALLEMSISKVSPETLKKEVQALQTSKKKLRKAVEEGAVALTELAVDVASKLADRIAQHQDEKSETGEADTDEVVLDTMRKALGQAATDAVKKLQAATAKGSAAQKLMQKHDASYKTEHEAEMLKSAANQVDAAWGALDAATESSDLVKMGLLKVRLFKLKGDSQDEAKKDIAALQEKLDTRLKAAVAASKLAADKIEDASSRVARSRGKTRKIIESLVAKDPKSKEVASAEEDLKLLSKEADEVSAIATAYGKQMREAIDAAAKVVKPEPGKAKSPAPEGSVTMSVEDIGAELFEIVVTSRTMAISEANKRLHKEKIVDDEVTCDVCEGTDITGCCFDWLEGEAEVATDALDTVQLEKLHLRVRFEWETDLDKELVHYIAKLAGLNPKKRAEFADNLREKGIVRLKDFQEMDATDLLPADAGQVVKSIVQGDREAAQAKHDKVKKQSKDLLEELTEQLAITLPDTSYSDAYHQKALDRALEIEKMQQAQGVMEGVELSQRQLIERHGLLRGLLISKEFTGETLDVAVQMNKYYDDDVLVSKVVLQPQESTTDFSEEANSKAAEASQEKMVKSFGFSAASSSSESNGVHASVGGSTGLFGGSLSAAVSQTDRNSNGKATTNDESGNQSSQSTENYFAKSRYILEPRQLISIPLDMLVPTAELQKGFESLVLEDEESEESAAESFLKINTFIGIRGAYDIHFFIKADKDKAVFSAKAETLQPGWNLEVFLVVDAGDGEIALYNQATGSYLKMGESEVLLSKKPLGGSISEYERFKVKQWVDNTFGLYNTKYKRLLRMNIGTEKIDTSAPVDDEAIPSNWNLERLQKFDAGPEFVAPVVTKKKKKNSDVAVPIDEQAGSDFLLRFGSHICPRVMLGGWWRISSSVTSSTKASALSNKKTATEAIDTTVERERSMEAEASATYYGVTASGGVSHSDAKSETKNQNSKTGNENANKAENENSVVEVHQEWKGGCSGLGPEHWRESLKVERNSNWKLVDRYLDHCVGLWNFAPDKYRGAARGLCHQWAKEMMGSVDDSTVDRLCRYRSLKLVTAELSDYQMTKVGPVVNKQYGLCMDYDNSKRVVVMKTCDEGDSQNWFMKEGKMRNSAYAGCLTKPIGSEEKQFNLQPCRDTNRQLFFFDGQGSLKSRHSQNDCVEAPVPGFGEVTVTNCHGRANQRWVKEGATPSGTVDPEGAVVYTKAYEETKCLTYKSANVISLEKCEKSADQKWFFDNYAFKSGRDGRCLDIEGGLKLAVCSPKQSQKFIMNDRGFIVSQDTKQCLDWQWGAGNMGMQDCHGFSNQVFYFPGDGKALPPPNARQLRPESDAKQCLDFDQHQGLLPVGTYIGLRSKDRYYFMKGSGDKIIKSPQAFTLPDGWESEVWLVVDAGFGRIALWNMNAKRHLKMEDRGVVKLSAYQADWHNGIQQDEIFQVHQFKDQTIGLYNPHYRKLVRLNQQTNEFDTSAASDLKDIPEGWNWEKFIKFKAPQWGQEGLRIIYGCVDHKNQMWYYDNGLLRTTFDECLAHDDKRGVYFEKCRVHLYSLWQQQQNGQIKSAGDGQCLEFDNRDQHRVFTSKCDEKNQQQKWNWWR